jgi:hypothetical protein
MRRLNRCSHGGSGRDVPGPVLREKAEETAKKLNTEFTPSNGWHE